MSTVRRTCGIWTLKRRGAHFERAETSCVKCASQPRTRRGHRLDRRISGGRPSRKRNPRVRACDDSRVRAGWVRVLAMDRQELEGEPARIARSNAIEMDGRGLSRHGCGRRRVDGPDLSIALTAGGPALSGPSGWKRCGNGGLSLGGCRLLDRVQCACAATRWITGRRFIPRGRHDIRTAPQVGHPFVMLLVLSR